MMIVWNVEVAVVVYEDGCGGTLAGGTSFIICGGVIEVKLR